MRFRHYRVPGPGRTSVRGSDSHSIAWKEGTTEFLPETYYGMGMYWDAYLKELVRYIHLNPLRARVAEIYEIDSGELYLKGRQKIRSEARSIFCYWAVRELGISGTHLAKRLGMSQSGVVYAVMLLPIPSYD